MTERINEEIIRKLLENLLHELNHGEAYAFYNSEEDSFYERFIEGNTTVIAVKNFVWHNHFENKIPLTNLHIIPITWDKYTWSIGGMNYDPHFTKAIPFTKAFDGAFEEWS